MPSEPLACERPEHSHMSRHAHPAETWETIEECDSCGGRFDTTMDPRVEAECDSQLMEPGEFTPGPIDPTYCENDGWQKIEHDLGRSFGVHESCFLDHDDILVRM